jgi:hypothetical protein
MMNNEDLERKMAFIVDQQAQFAVDIEKLQQSIHETNGVVTRLAYVTSEGFKDVNAKINALVDSQIANEELCKQRSQVLDAKISALIDSQNRTDEQLNRTDEKVRQLTATVDRYIRRGRNGG